MRKWLAQGWDMTRRHKHVGVLLFLYRLLWGFILFRIIDSVVTPVLARYPDLHPNADAVPLFLMEAEFRLIRTDLADRTLWLLLFLLLLRMVATPLLQAGVYYSFQNASSPDAKGTLFLAGVRRTWRPVLLLYWVQSALILLPAAWLIPMARERFFHTGSALDWLQGLAPYAAGWLVWGFLLHLLFQALLFGAVASDRPLPSAARAFRRALPLIVVSLTLLGAGLGAAAAVSLVSVVWSGLIVVVIHQLSHMLRALLTLWSAASQFAVWRETES